MSTPYTVHKRLDALEQTANKGLQLAKDAHTRLDVAPPRGEPGERGLKGDSIVGPAGRDAAPAKDGIGYPGATGPQGAAGRDGAPGRDAPQRVELDILRGFVERECKALRALATSQNEQIELLKQTIVGTNEKTQSYLTFLTERHAQRLK